MGQNIEEVKTELKLLFISWPSQKKYLLFF